MGTRRNPGFICGGPPRVLRIILRIVLKSSHSNLPPQTYRAGSQWPAYRMPPYSRTPLKGKHDGTQVSLKRPAYLGSWGSTCTARVGIFERASISANAASFASSRLYCSWWWFRTVQKLRRILWYLWIAASASVHHSAMRDP